MFLRLGKLMENNVSGCLWSGWRNCGGIEQVNSKYALIFQRRNTNRYLTSSFLLMIAGEACILGAA